MRSKGKTKQVFLQLAATIMMFCVLSVNMCYELILIMLNGSYEAVFYDAK